MREKKRLKQAIRESTRAPLARSHFPKRKAAKQEYRFPRIVISSEARNLPCRPINDGCEITMRQKNFCISSPMQNADIALRSLGSARDDDPRGRAISHPLSSLPVEGCPCGADLSSAFGAPLLQVATLLACKTQSAREISKTPNTRIPLPRIVSLPCMGKVASAARRIRYWRYENEREISVSNRR